MSRTKKGSKGWGYDYWSRRPFSGHGFGPDVKKISHGMERAQAKQALYKEPLEPDFYEAETGWRLCPVCLEDHHGTCDVSTD